MLIQTFPEKISITNVDIILNHTIKLRIGRIFLWIVSGLSRLIDRQ